jgi:peptidoglycan/LPS O-acetylase OafA/YrhL
LDPDAPERFHALDNLRAGMMLLGVVVHASLSYSHMPANPIWPFKDARSSPICDAIMTASGLCRMPIFFLVAGFFAALIHQKRGSRGLLADRIRRVGVPFVVGWAVTFPLARLGFLMAGVGATDSASSLTGRWSLASLFESPGPIHLWFLEYLLFYYVIAVGTLWMVRRSFSNIAATRPSARFITAALFGLTAIPLVATPVGVIAAPTTFWPEPVSFVAYGIFFGSGWRLFGRRSQRIVASGHPAGWIALAAGLMPAAGMLLVYRCHALPADWFGALPPGADASILAHPPQGMWLPPANSPSIGVTCQLGLAGVSALIQWLFCVGITGFFVRYFDRPIGWARYLANASYWIYLSHFPLMIWLPLGLADLDLPAEIKLLIVLAIAISLLLGLYEFLVRGTIIDGGHAGNRGANKRGRDPCSRWGLNAVGTSLLARKRFLTPFSRDLKAGPLSAVGACRPSRSDISNPCP